MRGKAFRLYFRILATMLLFSPLLLGDKPHKNEGMIEQPDTPAGRCAFAYIEAFNSGDEDQISTFWRRFTGATKDTLLMRIEEYKKYHEMVGAFIPLRIVHDSKFLISIQTRGEKDGAYWFLDFHLGNVLPHGLLSNTLTGPIHGDVNEEDLLLYVAADDLLRRKIIDKVSELLKAEYVFPDKAEDMIALISSKRDRGEYDRLSSLARFTSQLTKDLRSVYDDNHLIVAAGLSKEWELGENLSREERERQLAERQFENFGFHRVERMPGNIGYLDLRKFADPHDGGGTAVSALNFLAYCDAIIIDLRKNCGGSGRMVQLIASYFFDRATHLTSYYHRGDDSTRQFWTHAHVQGPRMPQTPLYLVQGPGTASSSEELAYALKHLGRATLVGEVTSGGAHATQERNFPDLIFTMHLPIGYAVNPVTGSNWEGRGVEPDIRAPAEEALQIAYIEALNAVLSKETDSKKKKSLKWILDGVEAERQAITLDRSTLTSYKGTYEGSIEVRIEKGNLVIMRPNHDPYHAIPMGKDLFRLKGEEQRVLFQRDDSGRVKKICVLFPDGRKISMDKVEG